MDFSQYFAKLAPLEWFDQNAFKEDDKISREVCGFVLSLALIYNDIKNTALLNKVLNESRPAEPYMICKEWGEFSALEHFIDRMTVGILHELFNLIYKNEKILKDKFFISIVKSVPNDLRNNWESIVNTSFEKPNENKLTKDLMFIRNKVSFHYDRKVIFSGYKNFFEKVKVMNKAYISRGENMPESRFYFADAAAQGSVQSIYGAEDVSQFNVLVGENLKKVNLALWHIINNFIMKRGFAFREVRN